MSRLPRRQIVVRRWRVCVNGDEDHVRSVCARLREKRVGDDNLSFLVFQLERGEETARLHIQAYVRFSVAKRDTGVNHFFGCQVDSRTCAVGDAENIAYCTKEETRVEGPWQIGETPTPGRRTDLEAVRTLVDEGADELTLWESNFETMCRHHQAIGRYTQLRRCYRDSDYEQREVRVYWGPTGTGKSRRAVFEAQAHGGRAFIPDIPDRPGGTRWFDGYDGTSPIILDDYGGEYGINFLKRLLDGYPMSLPVKGGYVARGAKLIIITSNKHPDDWYPEAPHACMAALRRRYTRVENLLTPWLPPLPPDNRMEDSDINLPEVDLLAPLSPIGSTPSLPEMQF